MFDLYISTASRSLLQQTEVTDVSHDQCHVTQAGVGLVGAPGQRLGSAFRFLSVDVNRLLYFTPVPVLRMVWNVVLTSFIEH